MTSPVSSLFSAPVGLLYSGQASAWQQALADAVRDGSNTRLESLLAAARARLAPVAREVATAVSGAPERLDVLLSRADAPRSDLDVTPAVSMPAIVLAQIAATEQLLEAGVRIDVDACAGHSQGTLGVEVARALTDSAHESLVDVLALSLALGAAISREVRHLEGERTQSRMLSVRGVCRPAIDEALDAARAQDTTCDVVVALRNGAQAFTLSGSPAHLERVRRIIASGAEAHNASLVRKERGGTPIQPVFDVLPVAAPFHNPVLAEAGEETQRWVNACGLNLPRAHEIITAITVSPCDWPEALGAALSHAQESAGDATPILLSMGPGAALRTATAPLVAGQCLIYADASSAALRDALTAPGASLPPSASWEEYAPRLVELPTGEVVIDTAFTRLTGNSPIILAGMTPTTVDPEIVAAAANAGYWAEMAGGGQYSPEVFAHNKDGLVARMTPGRSAQFNSMFFDRFMWNLQFGTQKIVSKARTAGAPINGVTVSAGIPEVDEALELIEQLHADGFPYICFKPGTVDQIRAVLAIADASPSTPIIMQVEDGHAGGHHSWENLSDLLGSTYADIRERANVVLCVGGGIGTPEAAARYLSGRWALESFGVLMPVDGILVGTAAMTTLEAKTSPQVKQLLVDTPGVSTDADGGWVGQGQVRGGMTSGLSHLHADMYEVANASARCSRLLAEVGSDAEQVRTRRSEIIEALNATAKPYFGDIEDMTYAQWVSRFVELSYPWTDPTWPDRFLDLLHRVEARLCAEDHGQVPTLFPDLASVDEAPAALERLLDAYPQAEHTLVGARDAAWFVTLCRKHHKPMPFVPAIDADVARWWGMDTLWQSHDARYSADAVRVIPGPVSVAGIDRVDEPVAQLLGRFEAACIDEARASGAQAVPAFARLGRAHDIASYLRAVPHIFWNGHLIDNPAHVLPEQACRVRVADDASSKDTKDGGVYECELVICCDTYWDHLDGAHPYAVGEVVIPVDVSRDAHTGAVPVVSRQRLPEAVYALLAGVAGIGSTSVGGDELTALPAVSPAEGTAFGLVHDTVTLSPDVFATHLDATGAAIAADEQLPSALADALVGPCWPAIYAALGSASLPDGYPVIEGLLNAVHLDHCVCLDVPLAELASANRRIRVTAEALPLEESASGRIVTVLLTLSEDAQGAEGTGRRLARLIERFAIRGRITSQAQPSQVLGWGGQDEDVTSTPRKFLRRTHVQAPANMTPFAIASGDYNPIHTSAHAAALVGLQAPLVHGMWLSATAQTLALASQGRTNPADIEGWTYSMYGMVQLGDEIDIVVERVGRAGGGRLALEVTCRIGDAVVSRAQCLLAAPRTAYVYPGQGIQTAGMGASDRAASPAARSIWERADAHTRSQLGFSIARIVDENPTSIRIGSTVLRHPKGVLNLTQFTQVALAVVAYAQTARLEENDLVVPASFYAGHSLGEYTALASCAKIFDLEAVIDVVYSRGSAMHALVPRDAQGRSNYRLGALRPNQCGVSADEVTDYVASVAKASGEFIEIVNYNLDGQQYAVAGTVAGLAALNADASARAAAAGGKSPYMEIPGIDVPFHSSVLRDGVPAFARTLDATLPKVLDYEALVGRYIPNLVARPFELTRNFAESICAVVPSHVLGDLLSDGQRFEALVAEAPEAAARLLLIELLSWQFASPVRWIETQALLISPRSRAGLGVEQIVEVGLASAPTLANLASKTCALPAYSDARVRVLNVQRDEAELQCSDSLSVPPLESALSDESEDASSVDVLPAGDGAREEAVAAAAPAPALPAPTPASGAPAGELAFDAARALMVLFALQTKLRIDQIGDADTTDTLTNGVSSRRNQMLMDMSAELGVASIEGAAEANVATLRTRANAAAPAYAPFGPIVSDLVRTRLRALFGGVGLKPAAVRDRVTGAWALPVSWVPAVEAEIVLASREGDSVRGGTLGTLPTSVASKAQAQELIDAAVQSVAAREGVSVSMGSASQSSGGVVDSAALDAFAQTVTGENGVFAALARTITETLGLSVAPEVEESEDLSALVAAVDAELGSGWLKSVTPAFDARQAVLFDDRWAYAREELARAGAAGVGVDPRRFVGTGATVSAQASWWASQTSGEVAQSFREASQNALTSEVGRLSGEVALVTGAAPGSIAGSLVAALLEQGATVVMTASRLSPARVDYARRLYAEHAHAGSSLWLVPANLSSYRDIDALVDWISTEQSETRGEKTLVTKPALTPTLLFPFAAPGVRGSLADVAQGAEVQTRLLLWSVEHTIARLSQVASRADEGTRVHVLLPGSPNRGTFGGDGAYGEVKAAFDAILAKWSSEAGWPAYVTLAQARIGWVAGTHLMSGNDALVPAAREAGIHVYSPEEITTELMALCTQDSREEALKAPLDVDLTGGLATASISLSELAAQAREDALSEAARAAASASDPGLVQAPTLISALPNLVQPALAEGRDSLALGEATASLEDMVVIVGTGEVGAWGSGRTRHEAEFGIQRSGDVDLTAAGVLELAWMMNLVTWAEDPAPGWYDASGAPVDETDIYERFRDEVVARCGVRSFVNDSILVDLGSNDVASVFLNRDIEFTVPTREEAEDFVLADPGAATIREGEDGEWVVTKRAGSVARVPKRATLTRTVGGQLPTGFDPANWGIPASMLDGLDRIAVWNLVTTVDAFLSAGFSPAELLQAVHPADVASTQGTGIGGMESLRQVFLSRFLGEDRPQDILQEALPNVVAAHVMQSYVGGYGSMIHPVAACATAAVSIEEGADKIRLGKSDFVVAGGIDDVSVESLTGFGDMNATANSAEMAAKGIHERFYSRANDRRRAGFVEAAGGGTVLLARASVAAELGLPVLAVVAHAASYADGAHTSIPAPGIGALGAARGGRSSLLARELSALGLSADDVRVVSKHDTSTNANDPNESELHSRLWPAVGRTVGNPLFVISQKTLTGHAKGGAALFQVAGLLEVLRTGDIPANASLDCVDAAIEPKATDLVWLRSPLALGAGAVKAAALTSLGFGHVAALVVLAHPVCFEDALLRSGGDLAAYRARATARLVSGARRLEAGMVGRAPLFEQLKGRRLPSSGAHEAEVALLLDASARLGGAGTYPLPAPSGSVSSHGDSVNAGRA